MAAAEAHFFLGLFLLCPSGAENEETPKNDVTEGSAEVQSGPCQDVTQCWTCHTLGE